MEILGEQRDVGWMASTFLSASSTDIPTVHLQLSGYIGVRNQIFFDLCEVDCLYLATNQSTVVIDEILVLFVMVDSSIESIPSAMACPTNQ